MDTSQNGVQIPKMAARTPQGMKREASMQMKFILFIWLDSVGS